MNTMTAEQRGIFDAEARDRVEWRALLETHGLEAGVAPALPGFATRVMAAARRDEAARAARRTLLWRWLGAASAAAACAAAVSVHLISLRGASVPSAAPESAASWLAARQAPDGTWAAPGADAAFRPALTALAALALLRQDAARHADAIGAAVAALEAMQRPDGSFGAPGPHALYNHAFATFALLGDARRAGKGLTPAIERALDFSVASQNAYAAWDYSPAGRGNDALTIWQLGLLAEARALGWQDGRGALRRGVAALSRATNGGLLDYRLAFGRETAPAAGGLVLTRLATRSITGFLDGIGGQDALVGNLMASLGTADAVPAREVASGKSLLPVLVALLEQDDD